MQRLRAQNLALSHLQFCSDLFPQEKSSLKKPTYSLGDLIDKLCILSSKIYFGDEQCISEHRHLEQGLEAYGIDGKIVTNVIRLTLMNRLIWEQEHESRK